MAWNGSDSKVKVEGQGQQRRGGKHHHSTLNTQRSTLRHGILAGLIVVALGGAAVWLMTGNGDDNDEAATNDKKPRMIAETTPHIVTNKPAEVAEKPKKKAYSEMTDDEKLADIRAKYGNNIPDNLKPVVYYLEHPPKREFKAPPRPSHIFKHSSERQLAEMLMVEPGSWMLLRPEFNDRFDIDFAASLNEKIEFDKDDTDFQRELKQTVIDTKAELAERVRKGEKASEIMNQFADELYEMGQYRQEIEKMVRDVKLDPKMTDADVEDCVKAANEMLAKKGIKPMSMPNMMFRQAALRIHAEKNNKENNK